MLSQASGPAQDIGCRQVETLTDRAYRALEEEIVTLRIPAGVIVSEALLSRRLSVGRTPIREPLQRRQRARQLSLAYPACLPRALSGQQSYMSLPDVEGEPPCCRPPHKRHRFPPEVIRHTAWLYRQSG